MDALITRGRQRRPVGARDPVPDLEDEDDLFRCHMPRLGNVRDRLPFIVERDQRSWSELNIGAGDDAAIFARSPSGVVHSSSRRISTVPSPRGRDYRHERNGEPAAEPPRLSEGFEDLTSPQAVIEPSDVSGGSENLPPGPARRGRC